MKHEMFKCFTGICLTNKKHSISEAGKKISNVFFHSMQCFWENVGVKHAIIDRITGIFCPKHGLSISEAEQKTIVNFSSSSAKNFRNQNRTQLFIFLLI